MAKVLLTKADSNIFNKISQNAPKRNAAVEQNARQYGCFFAKDNKNRFPNDGKVAFVQVFSSMTVWILDLTSAASSTVFMS